MNCWRHRSLLDAKKAHGAKQSMTFPGDRDHGMVPGLKPFSEYSLLVMAFNGRGNGPGSHPVTFKTPEGGKRAGWGVVAHSGPVPFQSSEFRKPKLNYWKEKGPQCSAEF